jgi:hypothetical protein
MSPGESEQEERPNAIKKGRGRPRVDGGVSVSDKSIPIPIQTPPFKKFMSGADSQNQYPSQLLNWYKQQPQWAKDGMIWYVEREWPVLKPVTAEDKARMRREGKEVEHNYIDKWAYPPEKFLELRDKYGSGDYHIVVNDVSQKGQSRTLAEAWVKENWRDIRTYPPTDRRIDRVESVELDDPSNRAYVEYLRGRGKLPEQNQGAANVAEATAVAAGVAGQSMAMADKLINRLMDSKDRDKGNNDTTATVVREVMGVMADVNKQAVSVMRDAQAEASGNRVPPMSLKDMVDVVKELKGGEKSDSTMLVEMMKEMRMEREATNRLILEGMKERIDRSERLVEKLMEQKITPTASAGENGGTGQVSGLVSGVDQIVSVVEKLGFRKNGVGVASGPEPSGVAAWLPDVMQAAQGIIASGVQAWTTKMQVDDRERQRIAMMSQGQPIPMGPVMQMPTMPQPVPPQQMQPQSQPQLSPASAGIDPSAQAPAPQTADEDVANFNRFMGEIHRPIMNHIRRNLGGAAFGQWIIDSYDESTFEQIREQGKEAFVEGLMSYPPLAKDLAGLQGPLVVFADEFVRMEEILADEALEDGENEGDGDGGEIEA